MRCLPRRKNTPLIRLSILTFICLALILTSTFRVQVSMGDLVMLDIWDGSVE